MAGPKRPPLVSPPPPRRAVVVDGANVIASSRRRPLERLALAEAWVEELEEERGEPFHDAA